MAVTFRFCIYDRAKVLGILIKLEFNNIHRFFLCISNAIDTIKTYTRMQHYINENLFLKIAVTSSIPLCPFYTILFSFAPPLERTQQHSSIGLQSQIYDHNFYRKQGISARTERKTEINNNFPHPLTKANR